MPCGTGGKRTRSRELALTSGPPQDFWEGTPQGDGKAMSDRTLVGVEELHQQYAVLTQDMQDAEVHRVRELAVAFALGCVSLLLLLASIHCTSSSRRASSVEEGALARHDRRGVRVSSQG